MVVMINRRNRNNSSDNDNNNNICTTRSNTLMIMLIIIIMIIVPILLMIIINHDDTAAHSRAGCVSPTASGVEKGYGVSTLFVKFNYVVRLFLRNGTSSGVTFGTGRGGTKVTPQIVSFSVSVLARVTNKLETPI